MLLAAVLAAEQVSFVLVGSAALWLQGETIRVSDIDVVPDPSEANLTALHAALTALVTRRRLVPPSHSLAGLDIVSVPTMYGKLDCLLARGRQNWVSLRQHAGPVMIADAEVLVASAADAWALRRAFKGDEHERA
jgi:hypothetical protein